ncbi:hypothetical protein A5724_03060 [Mycobacterium sp. ACS1612]|nr:hypothetical protein [Mycobacterium sp. ACS1612]OBF27050.1 hypothetical protein A5724_03060 [Mycobacterium sp. ACS1612]
MPKSASARALVLERPHRLVLRKLPLPDVGEDVALVSVQPCGLCGTDHEECTGQLAGVVVAGTRGFDSGAPKFRPDMVVLKELRVVGLDAAEDLLATMAGKRDDVPPVHGVVMP